MFASVTEISSQNVLTSRNRQIRLYYIITIYESYFFLFSFTYLNFKFFRFNTKILFSNYNSFVI